VHTYRAKGGLSNELFFYYNRANKQYYIICWNLSLNTGVQIADEYLPPLAIDGSYSDFIRSVIGFVAAFDSLGNHQWHYNTDFRGISSLDFDDNNNVYISSTCLNFGGVIHDNPPGPEDDGSVFIIKISADGIIDSINYRKFDYQKYRIVHIKYQQGVLIMQGAVPYDFFSEVYTLMLMKIDASLTGTSMDTTMWRCNPYTGAQNANIFQVFEIDRQGNYLFGGGVGSSFQLSPTVSIANSNSYSSLSDFFIAKYAKYECGEEIDPPASIETVHRQNEKILFYPNPAQETLNFDNAEQGKTYFIYNLTGILQQQGIISKTVNIRSIPNGIYILKIENTSFKLIISN
jgi:hypothetical protein